jgi:hypothetical protein
MRVLVKAALAGLVLAALPAHAQDAPSFFDGADPDIEGRGRADIGSTRPVGGKTLRRLVSRSDTHALARRGRSALLRQQDLGWIEDDEVDQVEHVADQRAHRAACGLGIAGVDRVAHRGMIGDIGVRPFSRLVKRIEVRSAVPTTSRNCA